MDGVLINDTLLIFAIIIGVTAFGMYAEKKWRWAGILSGMGVSIFTAVALVTCHVLPTASFVYSDECGLRGRCDRRYCSGISVSE